MRIAFILSLSSILCTPAIASGLCKASAAGSPGYGKAAAVVSSLPEVARWAKSHAFPVAYGAPIDHQELHAKRCYWTVTVYADRPERLELWQTFYVPVLGHGVLVLDTEGSLTTLRAWRKKVGA